jgi:hypothetical protein
LCVKPANIGGGPERPGGNYEIGYNRRFMLRKDNKGEVWMFARSKIAGFREPNLFVTKHLGHSGCNSEIKFWTRIAKSSNIKFE